MSDHVIPIHRARHSELAANIITLMAARGVVLPEPLLERLVAAVEEMAIFRDDIPQLCQALEALVHLPIGKALNELFELAGEIGQLPRC